MSEVIDISSKARSDADVRENVRSLQQIALR